MKLPVKIYYKRTKLDFPEYKWTYQLILEYLINAPTLNSDNFRKITSFEINESTRYISYSGLHYEVIGTIEDIEATLSIIYLR